MAAVLPFFSRRYLLTTLWFGLLLDWQILVAQPIPLSQLHVKNLRMEDGLLHYSNSRVYQDAEHFMWICSAKGVQRYDGYRFQNYNTATHFPGAKMPIGVWQVFEDSQKRLWAGTTAGLYVKDYDQENFRLVQDSIQVGARKKVLAGRNFIEDNQGHLWFSVDGALIKVNLATEIVAVEDIGLTSHDYLQNIAMDAQGRFWLTANHPFGLFRFDPKTGEVRSHTQNPEKEMAFDLPIKDAYLAFDKAGQLWAATGWNQQLYRVNLLKGQFSTYSFPRIGEKVTNAFGLCAVGPVMVDSRGTVWISLNDHEGIARYQATADTFEILRPNNQDPYGLHDALYLGEGASPLYEDRAGNLWYAGSSEGLSVFSPYRKAFTTYVAPETGNPMKTTASAFWQTTTGEVFVGYYGNGLFSYEPSLQAAKSLAEAVAGGEEKIIWSLFSLDNTTLYATTQHKNALAISLRNGAEWLALDSIFTYRQILATCPGRDSSVWLGYFRRGFAHYDPKIKAAKFFNRHLLPDFLPNVLVFSLALEGERYLWIAAEDHGLQLFDTQAEQVAKAWFSQPGGLPDNDIRDIQHWNQDTLLLSTQNGFCFFDRKNERFFTIDEQDGLPSNVCYSSLPDPARGVIWINTSLGLCKLSLHPFKIVHYGEQDGIADRRGDSGPMYRLQDGRILVPTRSGFVAFHPHDVIAGAAPTRLRVTGFYVNGQSLPASDRLLVLEEKQNNLRIEFSTLQFLDQHRIEYFFRLENVDTNWVSLGQRSEVEFRNLAPATYTLHLKCANTDGLFCPQEITLQFRIEPPFWKTGWFIALVSGLLFGGAVLAFNRRYQLTQKRLREKAELQQQIAEAENMALRAQLNPHFIFNCLNAINLLVAEAHNDEATRYLHKFARLMRILLDNSAHAYIPLSLEIEALRLYLDMESLRFNDKFNYQIELSPDLQPDAVRIPPTLLQPLVENAIWHGLMSKKGDRRLNIRFENEANTLCCVIEDNGIGRAAAKEMRSRQQLPKNLSHGLRLTESRLKLNHTGSQIPDFIRIFDLHDEQGQPAGTRVEIRLPMS